MIISRFYFLEDNYKASANAALGESADVEAVIGVDLEEYEVVSEGWEDVLGFLTGTLVNTYLSSILSTDVGSDYVATVR